MDVSTAEGVKARNTMHFAIPSDVFIPAGGRPNTINDKNFMHFIVNEKPISKLVVEGANIFFTPHARHELSKRGVIIMKDSSANKGGVICSSFEILAGMCLNDQQFLSVKKDYVENVLERLKELSRKEAELLLKEYSKDNGHDLPTLSVEISKAITMLTDAVHSSITNIHDEIFLREIIANYFPKTLLKIFPIDRVLASLPFEYLSWLISCSVASTLLYSQGLGILKITQHHKGQQLGQHLIQILQSTMKREKLLVQIKENPASASSLANEIIQLLSESPF